MDLKAEHLSCLRGERVLFESLSFSLKPGEGLFVRGANGAGKSSLLKLLAGVLRPYAGQILFGGMPIREDLTFYRRHIAYLGHLDGLKPNETAAEAVGFRKRLMSPLPAGEVGQRPGEGATKISLYDPPHPNPLPPGEGTSMLSLLNMQQYATTPVRYLSAGQRRRVALAGVLASGAMLWLLDEPTTALDAKAASLVYDALDQHRQKGGMFIAATHDDPPVMIGARVLSLA